MAQPDVGIDVSGVDVADVDRAVRVAVPAYGRIFVDCAELIALKAECDTTGEMSMRCALAEDDLRPCMTGSMCPDQFARTMACLGADPESRTKECMPQMLELAKCTEAVGREIYNAFAAEVKRRQ